jgi:hypothetical protein
VSDLPSPPTTLFGLPLSIDEETAHDIRRYLEDSWRRTAGRPLGEIEEDLEALDPFFNPIHVGRSVRDAVQKVAISRVQPKQPPFVDLLVVLTHDGRQLITPEGRVAIACLREARKSERSLLIDSDLVLRAQNVLLAVYRSWSQQRLRRVVQLASEKTAPPLLPPGLGVLVLLLVNRSTSAERAIVVPESGDPRGGSLGLAFSAIVSSFADAVAPSKRGRRVSLYSDYAITEARRRLPSQLSRDGSRLFIVDGREGDILDFVAGQLRRRKLSSDDVGFAFDRLVGSYRQHLPVFAQFGSAHERPAETSRIRRRLMDAVETK